MANDPAGLGAALARLGSGGRKGAKVAANAAAVLLREGEIVECAVQGQLYGSNAVVLLTNGRLLIVNDREFRPDVLEFVVDPSINVQGWQDDRAAALLVQRAELSAQIERIADKPLAQEIAQRIRARAAGQG
ncbi:MAG: hypothetical protein QOI95_1248 [Acidimicrobiaceae bacterium]|jgi:hypothetical protein